MTLILNSRETFAAESLSGFVDANQARVRHAPGGVVRATQRRPGKVAVVVGGGSGHFPAFAGLVGEGLADGAVCGDVFASPSTRHVMDVCQAADQGAGVWLSFGNYAGDVLNFSAAAGRLRAQGMALEWLAVTDDVASAPAGEEGRRRGVAGDLVVFKVAGAAAELGYDLPAVTQVAAKANDRTRSFGVAFSGCTLPGAEAPLFTLQPGTIAWGLGIHGEPGIGEDPLPPADEIAATMVDQVLTNAPAEAGRRLAVVVNGLGSVKYEELHVLFAAIRGRLVDAGYELVAPEVGEFVTSLDMAGCSLTVSWLDEELERLWLTPADAPSFRRTPPAPIDPAPVLTAAELPLITPAGPDGQAAGLRVLATLSTIEATLVDAEDELGRLDAIAGDGDHGRGMVRGAQACRQAAEDAAQRGGDAPTVLRRGAEAWADKAGGTSGALWGAGLLAVADALPTDAQVHGSDVVAGVVAAWEAVTGIGGARVGDKTMVDALEPFAVTLRDQTSAGEPLPAAWAAAAAVATTAAQATADIAARMGRSRTHGARSLGTPDPGAISFAACMTAITPTGAS